MLIKVCLLLLSVGVYANSGPESTTEDELFSQLDVFPENFLSKFPGESEFFTTKILVYLFFNIFAKYFGDKEPMKFWSKFNHNDYNRVAIDAAFYEHLTKFADKNTKHLIFDPLESSASTPEDIAIDRIGEYLDNLSEVEVPAGRSETRPEATKMKYYHDTECVKTSVRTPIVGVPGKDFPNYCEIPKTTFTCADKLVPGIYADIETGCQVFHVCLPHRIDSYLCPIGTTFNQALLTCDFWHESDCSSSPLLFEDSPLFASGETPRNTKPTIDETEATSEGSTFTPEFDIPEYEGTCQRLIDILLQPYLKFSPVKCRVLHLKQSTSKGIDESSKNDAKRFDRLMADFLSGNFNKEMFEFLIKLVEIGSKRQGAARWLELKKKWLNPKVGSKETEYTLINDDDMTSEEIYTSTTELPFESKDEFPPRVNSRLVEKLLPKETSQGKVKQGRSERKVHF